MFAIYYILNAESIRYCSRTLPWDIKVEVYVKNMEPGKMAFILCKTVCIFTNTEVVKRRQNNIHPKWF